MHKLAQFINSIWIRNPFAVGWQNPITVFDPISEQYGELHLDDVTAHNNGHVIAKKRQELS